MKKYVLLLPIMLFPFLASCNKDSQKESLTYGTYITSSVNSLTELSNEELLTKVRKEEVFLLAVYQGDYSLDCLCWATFQNVISNYINTYHESIYIYNSYNQDEELANLKIEKVKESTPYLYIYKGEKVLSKYAQSEKRNKPIFENTNGKAMYSAVHSVVNKPTMYFVDEDYLDDQIMNDKNLNVLFMRNKCEDCKYVIPNVIIPYIESNKPMENLYLFDMQYSYDLSKKEGATKEEKEQYQLLKNYYGLSEKGSKMFGYSNGVFPTIQAIRSGLIVDATVFFNDEIGQKEDGAYYISDSYYSEERLENLKYLQGCQFETKLKDMTVSEGVLEKPNGGYYWSQEVASHYHTPILNAFLTYYLK